MAIHPTVAEISHSGKKRCHPKSLATGVPKNTAFISWNPFVSFKRSCNHTKTRMPDIPVAWQKKSWYSRKPQLCREDVSLVPCHFYPIIMSLSVDYNITLCFSHRHIHTRQTYNTPPLCLFICMIISSCPKEQQQDIWCNTIAGSVPRGALSALYCKTTGPSSLTLSLLSREQCTLCYSCLEASWEHCIMGCLCVQTTGFIPTLSTFCTGEPLS